MNFRLMYVNGEPYYGPSILTPVPTVSAIAIPSSDARAALPNVVMPVNPLPINVKSFLDPNDDPKMQRNIIKYFYERLKEIYLEATLSKLLKYIIIKNNIPQLVESEEEYNKNDVNNNRKERINFILEKYFTKYDMELLLHKLVAKKGYKWYDLKTKHSHSVKKAVYKKIKERILRHLKF